MEGQQTCSRCKKQLSTSEFSLKKGDKYYKTCDNCRNKSIENKRMEESIEESIEEHESTKENDKKPKRENRPSISDEKKQIILREQDYKCRGPRVNDYYICAMNVSNMKFSDVKSVIPQYDHLIRWREGGNGIMTIQALCPNCHWMKTRMESLILEDEEAKKVPHMKGIIDSLSQPKINNEDSDSDSDSDFELITDRRAKRLFR